MFAIWVQPKSDYGPHAILVAQAHGHAHVCPLAHGRALAHSHPHAPTAMPMFTFPHTPLTFVKIKTPKFLPSIPMYPR